MRQVLCVALLVSSAAAAQSAPALDVVLSRMFEYVERFQREFGSMVAEERYEQTIRQGAGFTRGETRRDLRSDFLLVNVPGQGWTPFRDVFERNGQKVRDREERLTKLFIEGASRSSFDQARQIMLESSRYNIGSIERTINMPTLPLVFLTPALRDRFRFELGKRDPEEGTIVEFHEVRTPTYVSDREGHDMPSTGRYWLDEKTGAIRRTELDVVHSSVEAHIKVAYRLDDGLALWVPARMEERYRDRRTTSEVRGVATYSRFRKFQVNTSEEIAQ